MKQVMNIVIVVLVVIVGFVLIKFRFGDDSLKDALKNESRPNIETKPTVLVKNDKLVLVENLKYEYLEKAIIQYCNLNNQTKFGTLPSVAENENNFVVFFPFDTDFDNFCYFINYIQYAHDLNLKPDYKPKIKAWCTLDKSEWVRPEMIGKKAFIYIPQWDEECDNVYLTTDVNKGYKMGFAIGETCLKLDKPVSRFIENNIDLESLKGKNIKTFE